MKKIVPADITLGEPLPFSIYDAEGRLLLRQGLVVSIPDQAERLVLRGSLLDENEPPLDPSAPPARRQPVAVQAKQSPFEQFGGLILNLKHVIATALKNPEQINVTERVGKIARGIQEVCGEDVDSALAAPRVDIQNPYIVVHQIMGAVLVELIAKRREIPAEQRLSLICAALTRDLGQVPMQAELDGHAGPLPAQLRARMLNHPLRSAELLQSAGVDDPIWLRAVSCHHERLNGSGYPKNLMAEAISMGARMLAVADMYSAMEKVRPYRNKAHSAQNALKEIYKKKDAEIDGELAHLLVNQIGLLPPGTIVKLKCGEIGVIKSPTVRAEGATVYSIYSKSGMVLESPIARHTNVPGYEIISLLPLSECRTALATLKRVWSN